MSRTPKSNLLGQVIGGRFRVERLLGEGGMGEVYLGRHDLLGNVVAIKLLKTQHATDNRMAARFRREARATSRVQHPNVVGIFDTGLTEDGRLFLIMEYIQGDNLYEISSEADTLPVEQALPVFIQVADGLGAAHGMGIIHRDLKPDNIVLTRTEKGDVVKLLDFGLAKMVGAEDDRITLPGEVFGTPQYMAPEQCMGETLYCATDVYSFGAVAYEVLTGEPPYMATSLVDYVMMQKNRMPDPPSLKAPRQDVPPELDEVILKCLSREVANRYPDGAALAAALRQVQQVTTQRKLGAPVDLSVQFSQIHIPGLDSSSEVEPEELRSMVQGWLWDRLGHFVGNLRSMNCFPVELESKMASANRIAEQIARVNTEEQKFSGEHAQKVSSLRSRSGQLRQAVQDLSFERENLSAFLRSNPCCRLDELIRAFPGMPIPEDCRSVMGLLDELTYQITELEKGFSDLQRAMDETWETWNVRRQELTGTRWLLEGQKAGLTVEIIEFLIGPGGRALRNRPGVSRELEELSLSYQEISRLI